MRKKTAATDIGELGLAAKSWPFTQGLELMLC